MASFWGFGDDLFLFLFLLQGLGYLWLAPLSFPPSGNRATFFHVDEIFLPTGLTATW